MSALLKEAIFWGIIGAFESIVVVFVICFCMTAPARRNERARLFLDLLQTALDSGQSPERAIVAISDTHEASVSAHFHLLAAYIEEGATLAQGLDRANRFLPPGVAEVVKIGASENSLPRLLPAARAMLDDIRVRLRGAMNYVVIFLLVMVPAACVFLPMLSWFIWPRLREIMIDMEIPVPALTTLVFDHFDSGLLLEGFLLALILFFAFFYVGGRNVTGWMRFFGSAPDRLLLCLPWRRRRAQRDFASVLAVLLDAGLDETRAVELAGKATANRVFQKRAGRVVGKLREGLPLPEALRAIESENEFQWRWQCALRSGQGFFTALRGWHEALESRAFQQEQIAAHAITTVVVLLNGALVALIMSAVFAILIALINEGTLW